MPYHPQWHKPSPSPGDGIGLTIGKQHLQQYSDYTYAKPPHVYPTVLGLKNYRLGFSVFPLFFHGVFRRVQGFWFRVKVPRVLVRMTCAKKLLGNAIKIHYLQSTVYDKVSSQTYVKCRCKNIISDSGDECVPIQIPQWTPYFKPLSSPTHIRLEVRQSSSIVPSSCSFMKTAQPSNSGNFLDGFRPKIGTPAMGQQQKLRTFVALL